MGLGCLAHPLFLLQGQDAFLQLPNIFSESCFSVWLTYDIDTWHTVYALQSNLEGSHDNAVRVTTSAVLIHTEIAPKERVNLRTLFNNV